MPRPKMGAVKQRPKFNPRRCLECVYHGELSCGTPIKTKRGQKNVFCDYSCITGETCLHKNNHGDIYDIRGCEYDNCLMYEEGKPEPHRVGLKLDYITEDSL